MFYKCLEPVAVCVADHRHVFYCRKYKKAIMLQQLQILFFYCLQLRDEFNFKHIFFHYSFEFALRIKQIMW